MRATAEKHAVRTGSRRLLGFAASAVCLAGVALAQRVSDPGAASSVAAPRLADGLIQINIHVTDKSGKAVAGLHREDLDLLDNGTPVQLQGFEEADEASVQVVLVLDGVNLEDSQRAAAEKGIRDYLNANGGRLTHPTTVYRLGEYGMMVSTPSVDGNAVMAQLADEKKMRTVLPWPGLAYHIRVSGIPLNTALREFSNILSVLSLGRIVLEQRERPGRKLLIWIGRGWPTRLDVDRDFRARRSFAEWTELLIRMREAGMELENPTVWADPEVKQGKDPLRYQDHLEPVRKEKDLGTDHFALPVLAARSGGVVYDSGARTVEQVERMVAGQIAGKVREEIEHTVAGNSGTYMVSFRSAPTAVVDDYHALTVKLKNPEWTARTVMAYYDEPSFLDRDPAAVNRMTVEELGRTLEAGGLHDAELAARLEDAELTERPSQSLAAAWKAAMPGQKSRAALVELVNRAAFQPPPLAETPKDPAPDLAAQRKMAALMLDYLGKTIPHLPDLLATETIVHYQEPSPKDEESWKAPAEARMRVTGITRAGVVYRNGREELDTETARKQKLSKEVTELATQGTFGPILSVVVSDAARSTLGWSRWEQGPQGRVAVFRFAVPREKSHYTVSFCCLTDMDGSKPMERGTGYHGEMAVEPETGTILRLAIQADLEETLPLHRADILVEYGRLEIGGRETICPVRSVAITRKRTRMTLHEFEGSLQVFGPFTTLMNEVSYADYHRFGTESRILPGYEAVPDPK